MQQLDRTDGETLGDLGKPYVVPVEDWPDVDRIKFTVEIDFNDGKWPKKVEMALLNHAALVAAKAFLDAGALPPINFDDEDLTVQWYPAKKTIVVIFQRNVAGTMRFVPLTYTPQEKDIRWLCFARGWPKPADDVPLKDDAPADGETVH